MTGNLQMVGEGEPSRRVHRRSRFRRQGSVEELKAIKTRLANATDALIVALHSPKPQIDKAGLTPREAMDAEMVAWRASDDEAALEFRRLLPEALAAYHEALQRGYADPTVEQPLRHLTNAFTWNEVAMKLATVAARIDPRRDSKHWWNKK